MQRPNITLKGVFQFDIYSEDGRVKSSERVPNFITSTGLCYPAQFAFADCFRFLSLGSGTGANTIQLSVNNGWGTTGLSLPVTGFQYIGSRSGATSDTSLYESEACGYREQTNEVVLTRAWRVPTGGGSFNTDYTFKEFMLSPGRPASADSGCHCDDGGPDCAEVARYYTNPKICEATKAFTRIVRDVAVLRSDFLVVSYDLSVSFATGLKTFALAITNSVGGNDWSGTLRGYANIVHHGLKLINNGNIFNVPSPGGADRQQITAFYSYPNEYGESFVPSWGAPLEPSCPEANLGAYVTTDNLQFLVNQFSGGAQTGRYTSSGVMTWRSTPSSDVVNGWSTRYYSIRQDSTQPYYPVPADFRTEDSADNIGFEVAYFTDSAVSHTPITSFIQSGRSRSSTYSYQFWGNLANGAGFTNKPVRALTLGYNDGFSPYFVPFYDIILANTGTNNPIPSINTGAHTYTLPNSQYFYLQDGADLTLSFNMTWSSPCSSGVLGC